MEIPSMAAGIIKVINREFAEYDDGECLDINQLKNICNLYTVKPGRHNKSISLGEICISSPEFGHTHKNARTAQTNRDADVLKSPEFTKKYAFFIRIVFACLKVGVDVFNENNGILTLKNNYQLLRSLENRKKQLIAEHIEVLRFQARNITVELGEVYGQFLKSFANKTRIVDRVHASISKLIRAQTFEPTDNMMSLILPYFYTWTEIIEEYNQWSSYHDIRVIQS